MSEDFWPVGLSSSQCGHFFCEYVRSDIYYSKERWIWRYITLWVLKASNLYVNLSDNPNWRQNIVLGFTTDSKSKAFEKPIEHEARLGYGFPQSVTHNDLRTGRFVVDDTWLIEVKVDSPPRRFVFVVTVFWQATLEFSCFYQ